ncbi:MAG: PD-(D/E)XK nuclease family protein [Nitrosotalea sp.]
MQHLAEKYNLSVREDAQVEKRVLENLEQEYSSLRGGIHVSDLTLCIRQSVFRNLYPLPPSEKDIGYFLDGARRHETLQKLYQGNDPAHIITEKRGFFEGVSFSIDIYNKIPIEFKTTRANKAISEHWLRQLAYYMLASSSNIGILQVQRIVPRQAEKIFPAYLIEFTDEEQRIFWLQDFKFRKEAFKNAVDKQDPSLAPLDRGDENWLCKGCKYRSDCDELEIKAGRSVPK